MMKILNARKARQIVDDFSHATVLVVGDVMVDHFIWGKVSRISPEAPVPVVEVGRESHLLGGSANVMNNVIALGGKVFVCGVIGDDGMGRWLLDELGRLKVDTDGIVVEDDRPTTIKTRIVAHSQQVVRFDRESRQPVRQASVERVLEYIQKKRDELGAVVISDYNKGMVSGPLLDGIRKIMQGSGVVTCVDPKHSDFSLYRGFDVITPNHHEAESALGVEDINGEFALKEAEVSRAAEHLMDRLQLKAILITRGEEGMSLYERNGGITHIPTVAREVFDVTGAGDTAIGVFALSIAAGASFREAAVLANQAAGIAVGKVGTATVTREELVGSL
ncbi:MAG TPA: D-glycero-beta-D-manno-heptose-7-phosphate kinase [Syntrophales bacterium]|nr:D-glycero-beta-D-manno-heptose-7-phosphate kinase [Syntrophales bacterium]HRT70817.1 D-glycero-beta-D-manno-heptose-7-phosphate kinase [Syntrophales bacterium]